METASTEAQLEELRNRLDRMEQELAKFQTSLTSKLAQALRYLQKHEQLRDKHVRESLRQVVEQLTEIKLHLTTTPRVTH
jgi:predicted nuclease with TOPRIM domain